MAGKSCCGGGGGTISVTVPADNEIAILCDVAADGTSTPFLRRYSVDSAGAVTTTDTALDGTTAYTPAGTVGMCAVGTVGDESPGAVPSGKQILERCGCDDTDADGVGDVQYTELWAIDPDGVDAPVVLGTYQDGDLTLPYTPVAPVDCTSTTDATTPTTPVPVHTGGVNLAAATAATLPASGLQSLTVTALTGTTDVVTDAGTLTVPAGATVTWSVSRDQDQQITVTSVTTAAASTALVHWTNF